MAAFNPPWRLDPHLNPKEIYWGGAFVLIQVFAQPGKHKAAINGLRKGSKLVYSRSEETGEGFEGIFLIAVSGLPPRDDAIKPGDSTVVFNVELSGTEPANDPPPPDPNLWACFAQRETISWSEVNANWIGGPANYIDDSGRSVQNWSFQRVYTSTTPNPTQVGITLFHNGATIDGVDYSRLTTPPADETINHNPSLWLFDSTAFSFNGDGSIGPARNGRWIDTKQPCLPLIPDTKRLFTVWGWIFPHAKHQVDASDRYFPIKKVSADTADNKGKDSYTWSLQDERHNIDNGTYPFNMQVRKFRAFDLSTDHDGDKPLPPKPKGADDDPVIKEAWEAKKKKIEDENQKRFEARHKMLQLWPETFEYRISQFRYPTVPPPKPVDTNQPNLPAPIPSVLTYDIEWLRGLNGPPPVLQTLNEET